MLSQLGGGWASWYPERPLPKVVQPLMPGCCRGNLLLPSPLVCLSSMPVLAGMSEESAEAPAAGEELGEPSLGFLEEGIRWGLKNE